MLLRKRTWEGRYKRPDVRLACLAQIRHYRGLHKADPHPKDDIGSKQHGDGNGESVKQPAHEEGNVHQDHGHLAAEELDDEPRHQASDWLADECDASCKEVGGAGNWNRKLRRERNVPCNLGSRLTSLSV